MSNEKLVGRMSLNSPHSSLLLRWLKFWVSASMKLDDFLKLKLPSSRQFPIEARYQSFIKIPKTRKLSVGVFACHTGSMG